MIHNIIQMLSMSDHLGKSDLIEIAKGKYAIFNDVKGVYKQMQRELYMKDGRKKNNRA
jgi:hypothetical protein